jgi:hypothetical protein
VIYENITPSRLAAIAARAQHELGISISGNEGTATKNGITIAWVYDPSDQTLTVGDTRKPWYVPEGKIDEELTELVDSTEASREAQ